MKRALQANALVLVVLALVACATFTRDAYRTLAVSQQAYDATLSVMGDLYREGKVTEVQKQKIIELGRLFKLAHNGALVALTKYEERGGDAYKLAYLAAAQDATNTLSALLTYCRPFIGKGGP